MRRLVPLFLVLALSTPALAAPKAYEVDEEHASIGFLVSHVGFAKVLGSFREVEGGFTFDAAAPAVSDIRITIATDSVDTGHKARDGHLRKQDFLWADKYPTMTFVGTKAEQTGKNTGRITGDLTLRGVTRPVTLDVTLNKVGTYPFGDRHEAVGISARGTLKRSEFGMTYGVADGLVGDEVELIIELEGKAKG
ncbi:polyisoprenoid-binding protein [Aerophototrophica crusticola]|uniref:Polyisoprenoid-binding protein n=1 Tax=Aerophototrophica crusticola TaxID=1709002 RepID=A0A858R9U8_9PROT|nr:polyisoprenoid-binding protein [Rhodospirillaceae bacterium B3]